MKLFVIAVLAVALVSGVPVADKTKECEPGSFSDDGCKDGLESCTSKICPETSDDSITIRKRREAVQIKCTPGETKDFGCSTCVCVPDGLDMSCSPNEACLDIDCEPNSKFMNDCNSCTCDSDGMSAFCTKKVCPSAVPKENSETTNSA